MQLVERALVHVATANVAQRYTFDEDDDPRNRARFRTRWGVARHDMASASTATLNRGNTIDVQNDASANVCLDQNFA